MRKPRFTDETRYPNGYTPAAKTDIRKTFARIRAQERKLTFKSIPEPIIAPEPIVDTHVVPMRRRGKGK